MEKYKGMVIIFILSIIVAVGIYFYVKSPAEINGLKGANFKSEIVKGEKLKYRFYTPQEQTAKLPLVIYFHGAAERGNNNKSQLNAASLQWVDDSLQQNHSCYVLIPQCNKNKFWVNIPFKSFPLNHYNQDSIPESDELRLFMQLLNELTTSNNIDTKRIYLVGFSMGSSAVWDLLTRHPDTFAAAIAIAGSSDTSKASVITHIPIKVFNGADDHIMPPALNAEMCKAINRNGGNCELKIFENVGHDCVELAYSTPNLYDWLFSQQKN